MSDRRYRSETAEEINDMVTERNPLSLLLTRAFSPTNLDFSRGSYSSTPKDKIKRPEQLDLNLI